MMLSKGSVVAVNASRSTSLPVFKGADLPSALRASVAPRSCEQPCSTSSACTAVVRGGGYPKSTRAGTLRVCASSVDVKQPTPVVRIDNQSDAFATIVSVQYGERLGELLETVTALKNLSLNIRRAKVASSAETCFYVTEAASSEKVMKSSRLEEIRMTVINSLVETFPESAANLGGVGAYPAAEPKWLGRREVIPTTIQVEDAPNGAASLLKINTTDRPGKGCIRHAPHLTVSAIV